MTVATQDKAAMAAVEKKPADILERVLIEGDLAKLTAAERVAYYLKTCESLSINALTKPFEYIVLNGKLTLYVQRTGTDQLRATRGVSIARLERERLDDLYVVTAYATDKTGRSDSAIGAVNVKNLAGEALANALMKAETKAKRRVTLSLVGLGWTDESEVSSIPGATTVVVDHNTGEVVEKKPPPPPVAAPVAKLPEPDPTRPEFATEYDEELEHAVCADCERYLYGPDGELVTSEQSAEIVARYGRVLCKMHRPKRAAPPPATAA